MWLVNVNDLNIFIYDRTAYIEIACLEKAVSMHAADMIRESPVTDRQNHLMTADELDSFLCSDSAEGLSVRENRSLWEVYEFARSWERDCMML